MRQLDCQGHFGGVVACLLILRLSFTAEIWTTVADAARGGIVAPVPVGRMAKPSEMEAAVLFLLSDKASYVAGAELCVGDRSRRL
ncbi:SDR family oxidoreductase [Agrobacterium cavarae]|uniref:SDR family oxidoreductase n=1 Tax=Agrobacterium cavarae TaxID=2528239 RepID=A0ABY1Y5Z3_9HYPH|nr:SDR family oxidoreductase [Agrobacterium cavarae]TBN11382.1 SDR family oxidoreductase [Agrobacterium cavarae]